MVGGSREYVHKILKSFEGKRVSVRVSEGVSKVARVSDNSNSRSNNNAQAVDIFTTQGKKERYDHVIFASHAGLCS